MQIKYYKHEKSGPPGRLSVGLITASGLILLQIKGPGARRDREQHRGNSLVAESIPVSVFLFRDSANGENGTLKVEEVTCS